MRKNIVTQPDIPTALLAAARDGIVQHVIDDLDTKGVIICEIDPEKTGEWLDPQRIADRLFARAAA